MTLDKILENSKNTDSNGITLFVGSEVERHSIDLTGNGDQLTLVKYDNDLWAVEDDLQGSWTHFTEDVETTIESYIEEEEDENRIESLKGLLEQINSNPETDIKVIGNVTKTSVQDFQQAVFLNESEAAHQILEGQLGEGFYPENADTEWTDISILEGKYFACFGEDSVMTNTNLIYVEIEPTPSMIENYNYYSDQSEV